LNNDIGHPGRRRKRPEELDNCFESSGRGSDPDDRQRHVWTRIQRRSEYKSRS